MPTEPRIHPSSGITPALEGIWGGQPLTLYIIPILLPTINYLYSVSGLSDIFYVSDNALTNMEPPDNNLDPVSIIH